MVPCGVIRMTNPSLNGETPDITTLDIGTTYRAKMNDDERK